MTSRIPYSAKGKGISYYQKESSKSYHKYPPRYEQERGDSYQSPRTRKETTQDFSAPPLKRIRAPDVDTSDLIEENALTLMGRLTNPSAQRLWSLIPYLSNRWNLRGKAIGSDLGNGCFQFRFDFEEDLTKGLPMHFWKQQMIYKIGEELGTILDHEITPAAAKVKVELNGLAPLTKQTIVEFPDGSEALVTLEYKNLKKHCFHCQRLSHEIANCPGLEKGKSDAKSPPAQVIRKETPKRNDSAYNREQSRVLPKESYSRNSRPSISKGNYTPSGRQYNGREAMTNTSSGSRTYGYRHSNARRSPPRPLNYSSKVPARSTDRPYHSNSRPNFQWRERISSPAAGPGSSETSRTRRPPLERGSTAGESSPTPRPVPTTEEIMGELREVTVQYTNCADPTESMARKQRVLQGEARGLMAETAAQILAAAVNIAPSSPDLPPHPSTLTATGTITMKKKRGRPPLNKTVNKSPLNLKGAKSSKRNKELIQNSPRRRSTGGKSTNAEDPIPPVPQRKSAKQRLTMPNEEAGPSTTREPPQPLVSPHSPGGGGLAILWKDHIELETLEACPNFIDTHIKAEGKSFFATFVYGEPDKSKRKSIWEQLSTIGQARSDPWYLTGDFNDIIDSSEKQGGPNRPEGSFIDFRTFMSERLRNNKEVSQLIINQWKPDEDEDVEKKLSRCRTAIITWTREKHLNSQKRIEEARTKLELEMSSTSSNTLRIAAINEELRLAYKDEEDFWKQRSRQLWLTLGNGKDTLIWKDPWISLTSPVTPMGPATSDSQNLTVDQLICPVTGEWNRDKIQQLLPEYAEQILEIKMSKLGAKDAFAWLPTKSGTYSAKSGYYESLATSAEESVNLDLNKDFKWSKNIWHIKSSPKTKFFVWKVMRGAIPVGENLRSRGLEVEAKCPFCDEIESTLHLFFKCRFASQIWERAPFKTPVCTSNLTSFRAGLEGVQNLVCLPPSGLGEGPLHTWILWKIWLARNQQIFNKCHDSPQETLSQAIKLAREWQEAQRDTGIQTPNRAPPIHQLPGSDVILCQSDAAWDESSKQAGLGWIFSNRSLDLSRSDSKAADHIRSPLLAEGLALLEALIQAHNLGFTKLSVASDSKQLIEAIKSETHQKELHGILHDILTISSTFVEICFRFIPREKNREADALAKHALRNSVVCTR
ncbi:unnamed protein product [Arabidopsis halleri]